MLRLSGRGAERLRNSGVWLLVALSCSALGAQGQGFCAADDDCLAPQVCGKDPDYHNVVRCHCPCVDLNSDQCQEDRDCGAGEECIWIAEQWQPLQHCCSFTQHCQKKECSAKRPCGGPEGMLLCVEGLCEVNKGFVEQVHHNLERADLPINLVVLILCLSEILLLAWFNMGRKWSRRLSNGMVLWLGCSILLALKLLPWNLYLNPPDPFDELACRHVSCGTCLNIMAESVITAVCAAVACYLDLLDIQDDFLGPRRKLSLRRELLLLLTQLLHIGIWTFRIVEANCPFYNFLLLGLAVVVLGVQGRFMQQRRDNLIKVLLEAERVEREKKEAEAAQEAERTRRRHARIQRIRTFTLGETIKDPPRDDILPATTAAPSFARSFKKTDNTFTASFRRIKQLPATNSINEVIQNSMLPADLSEDDTQEATEERDNGEDSVSSGKGYFTNSSAEGTLGFKSSLTNFAKLLTPKGSSFSRSLVGFTSSAKILGTTPRKQSAASDDANRRGSNGSTASAGILKTRGSSNSQSKSVSLSTFSASKRVSIGTQRSSVDTINEAQEEVRLTIAEDTESPESVRSQPAQLDIEPEGVKIALDEKLKAVESHHTEIKRANTEMREETEAARKEQAVISSASSPAKNLKVPNFEDRKAAFRAQAMGSSYTPNNQTPSGPSLRSSGAMPHFAKIATPLLLGSKSSSR